MTDSSTDTATPAEAAPSEPLSLYDIAMRHEADAAKAAEPEAIDVDTSDLDVAADPDPVAAAPAPEAPKAPEPNPYEQRASALETELYTERQRMADLRAELEIAREDAERLVRALRESKVVDEREFRIRELEMQKVVAERQAELKAEAEAARAQAQTQYAHQQRVDFYAREIPAAVKANPILSEAEIVDAIGRLPPNAPENIPEIARQLAEQKMAIYRRHVNEQRRQARALPSAKTGTPPPPSFALNREGFTQLMERYEAGVGR